MRSHVWVLAAIAAMTAATATMGCGNKAAEAQKVADEKAAEATKAQAAAASAQKDADDKAAAAKKDAAEAAAKANSDAKATLQKELDSSDRKISYLKDKVTKATGATRKNADAALAEVDARHATVVADMSKLDGLSGTAWDTAKTKVEADTAALNKATDALETTLKK